MFTMNLNKLNVNEAELKAYIYQQLNAIQPYVGDAAVAIKMAYTADEKMFVVKMMASNDDGNVEVEGFNEDVYHAITAAKDALIRTFSVIEEVEEDDGSERAQEIQSIIDGKNYVH